MMHKKKIARNHLYFAAQAKSQESARAETKKAWRKASKKGQCAAKIMGKLICICLMMLFISIATYKIFDKFYLQQASRNLFRQKRCRKMPSRTIFTANSKRGRSQDIPQMQTPQ